jgi:hypothetical protein
MSGGSRCTVTSLRDAGRLVDSNLRLRAPCALPFVRHSRSPGLLKTLGVRETVDAVRKSCPRVHSVLLSRAVAGLCRIHGRVRDYRCWLPGRCIFPTLRGQL